MRTIESTPTDRGPYRTPGPRPGHLDLYRYAWRNLCLVRVVLISSYAVAIIFFPIGLVVAGWITSLLAAFRCPRCRKAFADSHFQLLTSNTCASCGLVKGTPRIVSETS